MDEEIKIEMPKESEEAEEVPNDDLDSKIEAALEKAQKKLKAQADEAERLSKLSEEERTKAELEALRQGLTLKEEELRKKELMLETTKVLESRNLPVKFLDFLIGNDSETTLKRIKEFEKEFNSAIEAGVNERLKSKTPSAGGRIEAGSKRERFMQLVRNNQARR